MFVLISRNTRKTKEFVDYFKRVYASQKNQWALCYRMGSINTNMYVEAFHRVLKYVYFHGRVNRCLDTLVFTLLNFARDKAFDRLIKLSKRKAGINRSRMIHERHQTSSLKLPGSISAVTCKLAGERQKNSVLIDTKTEIDCLALKYFLIHTSLRIGILAYRSQRHYLQFSLLRMLGCRTQQAALLDDTKKLYALTETLSVKVKH